MTIDLRHKSHFVNIRTVFETLLFVFLCVISLPQQVHATINNNDTSETANHLIGDTECVWGDPDCNPCVYEVEDNFYHISDNNGNPTGHTQLRIEASDDSGELMCQYSDPCELTAFYQHIQGIGRIPNVDENNWFVFTRSIRGGPGAFFAGQMTDLPSAGGHLGSATNEDDSARQITEYYLMDALTPGDTALNHYGGLQMLGKHMVTGTECYEPGDYDCYGIDPNMAYIYDFSDPSNVSVAVALDIEAMGLGVGKAVAATKLYNGNYLLVVHDGHLNFILSETDTLDTSTTWYQGDEWSSSSLIDGGAGNSNWGDYQNINIVNECETGDIYMIGTYRNDNNEDWMTLMRFEENEDSLVVGYKIAQKHMYCEWCNFSGTGNIYITPERNMVLYASDKDDQDGLLGSGDILFEEFQNSYNECNEEFDDDCDYDDDGLTNAEEIALGTNKFLYDTDEDGLSDGEEVDTYNSDPLNEDSDGDSLSDGAEVNDYETDPNNTDSDGDSITDDDEVNNGLDPTDNSDATADNDGDGLTNAEELNDYETDINNEDTDADGLTDGFEVNTFNSDPLLVDTDNDGLTDENEYSSDTDPNDTDTDDDGLTDGDEVNIHGTDPTMADPDNDGLNDSEEVLLGTDPYDEDTDRDGLIDGDEVNTYNTDPLNADTDDDELSDGEEVLTYETDPVDPDSDDEGLLDGEEVLTYETDPLDADTDNDSWSDYQEVNANFEKDPLKFDNLVQTANGHDFDGDGFGDLLVYYPEGNFYLIKSNGQKLTNAGSWITGLGDYSSVPLAGDFNGDGKDDVAALDVSEGTITVGLSNGSSFSNQGQWISGFGINSVKQLTGDFDGNGKDDIAVMDSEGNWSIAISSGSSFSNSGSWLSTAFEDAEVLSGDFDEDGTDDLLGFDAGTGEIQVALSTGNAFSSPTTWLVSFGTDSTQYFAGDFDGNGQDDFIVYHDNGTFEVATSLGDSFEDRGTLGNNFPTSINQIAISDLTGDNRIDLAGYTMGTNNATWLAAVWSVQTSNGSYFVNETNWSMGFWSKGTFKNMRDWLKDKAIGAAKRIITPFSNLE